MPIRAQLIKKNTNSESKIIKNYMQSFLIPNNGECQGSCRLNLKKRLCCFVSFFQVISKIISFYLSPIIHKPVISKYQAAFFRHDSCILALFRLFNATSAIGFQFLVFPDHRSGRLALASI